MSHLNVVYSKQLGARLKTLSVDSAAADCCNAIIFNYFKLEAICLHCAAAGCTGAFTARLDPAVCVIDKKKNRFEHNHDWYASLARLTQVSLVRIKISKSCKKNKKMENFLILDNFRVTFVVTPAVTTHVTTPICGQGRLGSLPVDLSQSEAAVRATLTCDE